MALDWKQAEEALDALVGKNSLVDIYVRLNVVAPLRERYRNGERTVRLYKEIMSVRFRPLRKEPRNAARESR